MPRGHREPLDSAPEFEKLLHKAANRVRYVLRLYVTGRLPISDGFANAILKGVTI
jgi:hypothetical protein